MATILDKPFDDTSVFKIAKPRILIVDDEELIRDILKDTLKQNYTVDVAAGGTTAIEHLVDYQYTVILLDINMPGLSGKDILKYCKTNLPYTEIIMISGELELETAVDVMKSGAYDFIKKPFTREIILSKVEEAVATYQNNISKTEFLLLDNFASKENIAFHGYKVKQPIGSGSMGIVLCVEKDGKEYAMKILRQETENMAYDISLKRFMQEAKILSELNHPNIINIYDYGFSEIQKAPYIVMEMIPGHLLIDLIKEDELLLEQKIEIIKKLATGLDAVHKQNIIHRDIKPSNILMTRDLEPKLTDFGIARTDNSSLTLIDELLGSPVYMAPECFDLKKPKDNRSDIFSLGILSYELLTGEKPFNGNTLNNIMKSIRKGYPIAPTKLIPELPTHVQDIIAKMLNKKPEDRYQTCSEILDDFNIPDEERSAKKQSISSRILNTLFTHQDKSWR